MRFEKTVEINASIEASRAAVFELQSWPDLTASITSLELLDPGPLRVGTRVRIKQPRLPRTTWTVTEVSEDGFTYEARGPGLRTTARHELTASEGSTRLRLQLDQDGPTGPLIGWLTAGLTRKYLDLESAGMKRKAEAGGVSS